MIKRVIAAIVVLSVAAFAGLVLMLPTIVQTALTLLNPYCLVQNFVVTPVVNVSEDIVDEVGGLIGVGGVASVFEEQIKNALLIYQIGKMTPGITKDDIILAIEVANQESQLQNLGWQKHNDHNSIGLFQQQFGPDVQDGHGNEYWGTAEQLHDPVYTTQRYYKEVLKYPDRATMTRTEVIRKVQRPGDPAAYEKYFDKATKLFEAFEKTASKEQNLATDNSVAVVGDSLTIGADTYMIDDLAQSGYADARIDAQSGRNISVDAKTTQTDSTDPATSKLAASKQLLVSGVTAIKHFKEANFNPKTWLILLGTNDLGFISSDPVKGLEDAKKLINQAMDAVGPGKTTLWLSVWNTDFPEKSEVWNNALKESAKSHSGMIIGNWSKLAQENPGWFADSVHYTAQGYQQRSAFVNQLLQTLDQAMNAGSSVVDAVSSVSDLLPDCNGSSGASSGGGTIPNIDPATLNATNGPLVQAALSMEQWAGGRISYGASLQKWLNAGRKGSFGHGNKDDWAVKARADAAYRSLDCSGAINTIVYRAYGINYNGCSYDYKKLVIGGKQMTTTVMEGHIDPTMLRPGDFIIKMNKPCGSTSEINHIVMVVAIQGNSISVAESHAGKNDGYEIRPKDVAQFNSEWPDLVVSRWIGDGASQEATSSTTTSAVR